MPEREPFYSKSTLGYLVVGLTIAIAGGVASAPLGNLVAQWFLSKGHPARLEALHPIAPTPSQAAPEDGKSQSGKSETREEQDRGSTARVAHVDPQETELHMEYDRLVARLAAVDESLTQRQRDLAGLPVKPEIVTSLRTSQSDLAAAEMALRSRKWDVAAQRMEQVRAELKYLESL
jgi:hypothetical protein